MKSRAKLLTLLLASVLGVTAIWSYGQMASRREAALAAREDLHECRSTAARIETLRKRPAMAADRERQSGETASAIEMAAQSAGIASEQLLRISPEPPQRLGDSAYKEKPIAVTLRNIRLDQLVKMTFALESGELGLNTRNIRLNAAEATDGSGLWSADVVMTYLIYEPQTAKE
ncbi:MAG: hypothetical protein WC869_14200 [Phycisphaerae bacterium]